MKFTAEAKAQKRKKKNRRENRKAAQAPLMSDSLFPTTAFLLTNICTLYLRLWRLANT